MSQFYAKGTIKVKNVDGVLEPFLPRTDVSCISDSNNVSLTQKITNLETQVTEAENSGGIEIMYIEPDEYNASDIPNETMMAIIEAPNDEWIVLVDTRTTSSGKKTGIPFNLYGQSGITLTVDWGDENTSTLTSSNYTAGNASASVHEYTNPGVYEVRIKCNDWNNVYFVHYAETYSNNYDKNKKKYITTGSEVSYNSRKPIYYWQYTLEQILTPIPSMKGCMYIKSAYSNNPSYDYYNQNSNSYYSILANCINLSNICPTGLKNIKNCRQLFNNCYSIKNINCVNDILNENVSNITNFYNAFAYCKSLTTIPSGLFDRFTNATTFSSCFSGCTSLTSIPTDLFKYNTAVTDFSYCFSWCSSLTSIPTDLFKYNTLVTTFNSCFCGCTTLTSIPTDLFRYNTAVTNFASCFSSSSYGSYSNSYNSMKIASIPQDLFKYNTLVTDFRYTFHSCTEINDITLHIGSPNVINISSYETTGCVYDFINKKTGTTRTVYVPQGSTTQTNFNSVASSLGLTIVGE